MTAETRTRPQDTGQEAQPQPYETEEPLLNLSEVLQSNQIEEDTAVKLAQSAREKVARAFGMADAYGEFTPAVASAIAHHSDPQVRRIYPTAAQIKEHKPLARLTHKFLNFFSPKLGARFDRFLERKAAKKITRIAERTTSIIDTFSHMTSPKEQFVAELERMYTTTRVNEGGQREFIRELTATGYNNWIQQPRQGAGKYKLLGKLMNLGRIDLEVGGRATKLHAAAPEIVQGIERFLKRFNPDTPAPSKQSKPTLERRLAERYAPNKLSILPRLPGLVDSQLIDIYNMLPVDGHRFSQQIYQICKKITERSHQGESGQDITRKLIQEMKSILYK